MIYVKRALIVVFSPAWMLAFVGAMVGVWLYAWARHLVGPVIYYIKTGSYVPERFDHQMFFDNWMDPR